MKEFFPIIRSSQLFSGVSEEELTAMLSCLETRKESFPKDALLLRIGDTADAIGLVLSGSILIIQEDIWGNRNIISKAGVGQTFAAAYACAPGSVLNVSVVAETAVTVLYLNIKRVLHVCSSACAHHSHIILKSAWRACREKPPLQRKADPHGAAHNARKADVLFFRRGTAARKI